MALYNPSLQQYFNTICLHRRVTFQSPSDTEVFNGRSGVISGGNCVCLWVSILGLRNSILRKLRTRSTGQKTTRKCVLCKKLQSMIRKIRRLKISS